MIRITDFNLRGESKIQFEFSDGTKKMIDFEPFIGEDNLSKPLSDPTYFRKVELIENGRGIFWPNDLDFCPDFLYQYQADKKVLVKEKR